MKDHAKPASKIAEEAAEWLVRLDDDADAQTRAEFFAWVQQSAMHVKEFLFASEAFRGLDAMDPAGRIDVQALLAGREDNVVSLQEGALRMDLISDAPSPAHHRRRKHRVAAAVAVLAGVAVAGAYLSLTTNDPSQVFATTVGEQRSFKLADGSVMHLNARSRVQVAFSSRQRHVELLDGEALFVVERDPARPFRVETATTTVQALGTQFNVYRHEASTTVSVVEGSVRVSGASTALDQTLRAGEQVDVADGGRMERRPTDISKTTAWRLRRLVFQDTPLAEVAEEFNRYNALQIQVEDAKAREKRLIGVFNADDPASLLLFLQKDRSLVVEKTADRLTIRSHD